jgi:hypothetical protein
MASDFEDRVWYAIVDLWPKSAGMVSSETIRDYLVEAGVAVPEGALERALEGLRVDGSIRVAHTLGREAIAQHGGVMITAVGRRLP